MLIFLAGFIPAPVSSGDQPVPRATGEWLFHFGTEQPERIASMTLMPDGGFAIAGSAKRGEKDEVGRDRDDLLLVRLNSVGEKVWMRLTQGPGASRGSSVASDDEGFLYVDGTHSDAVSLGSGVEIPRAQTQPGPHVRCLSCFSKDGAPIWAMTMQPGANYRESLISQALPGPPILLELSFDEQDQQYSIFGLGSGGFTEVWSILGTFFQSPMLHRGVRISAAGEIWFHSLLSPGSLIHFGPDQIFEHPFENRKIALLARFTRTGTFLGWTSTEVREAAHTSFWVDGTEGGALFRADLLSIGGIVLRRLTAEGGVLWEREFNIDGRESFDGALGEPLVFSGESLYLITNLDGQHVPGSILTQRHLVRRFDAQGRQTGSLQITADASGGVTAGMTPDGLGGVVVFGSFEGGVEVGRRKLESAGSIDLFAARLDFEETTAPELKWTLEAGALVLRWPEGHVLQAASSLAPADWQDHPGRSPLSIAFEGTPRFFRLRTP
jgi:hypothetical protein